MESDEAVTGPVNLGNPGEFTIKQLAEQVIAETGTGSEVVYRPLPEDAPLQRCPDISLAKAKRDWSPGIPLADGLKKTIAYFRDLLA